MTKDEEIKQLHDTIELAIQAIQKNMTILGSIYAKVENLETENIKLKKKIESMEKKS